METITGGVLQRKTTTWEALEILRICGGYYECPKIDGARVGPLVGYAGRDEHGKQYVGDVYVNFAKAERHGYVRKYFAERLHVQLTGTTNTLLKLFEKSTGFCGAPEGGKALAGTMADRSEKQYIFPEKKVTAAATKDSREISELVFDRHEPEKGESWWIVEDVCNNFSTTAKLVALIEKYGASVCGILCFLNRSLDIDAEYRVRDDLILPVLSVVRKPIPQYKQDNPDIAAYLASGDNIVWKPKNDWARLELSMSSLS
jgi:adenine/guanine phosphoribosyltransferase-like PRPP-binding protein